MKRILLAAAATCACAGPLLAADLGPYEPAPYDPPPAYAPPMHRAALWSGAYIGANAGYSWGNDYAASVSGPGAGGAFGALEPDGWSGGGQVGFNMQFDRFVLGLEADLQSSDISDRTAGFGPGGAYYGTSSVDIDWYSTVRGRIGYAAGPALLYFTGGLAFADVDYRTTIAGPANVSMSSDSIKTGYTLGGGLEWKFAPQWSLKSEYLYVDLGDETLSSPGGAYQSTTGTDFHTVRVGLNYHF